MHGPDRPGLMPDEALAALLAWRSKPLDEQHRTMWSDGRGFSRNPESAAGRLRVGLWAPCLGLGGAEVWMDALRRGIDRSRVSWRGLAVIGDERSAAESMLERFRSSMPVGFGIDAAAGLASDCDVILLWGTPDVPGILDSVPVKPIVVSVAHMPGDFDGPNWYAGGRGRGIDKVVAVSELALEGVPDDLKNGSKIIWNAVDPDRLEVNRSREEMRRAWGIPEGRKVVGYLGRMSPEKDPGAMQRLAEVLPESWIAVAVGWPAGSGSGPKLIVPGPDPAAGDVLNAFDTLIVPSHYESFGLTIAEGLAMGVAVISTSVGLAKLRPDLTRSIPIDASGAAICRALLLDDYEVDERRDRTGRGMAFAEERLTMRRFGREWGRYLQSVAGPEAERYRLSTLADMCKFASGPCGCGAVPRICNLSGSPVEVYRPRCLQCVAGTSPSP